jgi:hypothetical protein
MLLERRARALADAAGVPLESLDVALFNFGAGEDRSTLGASEDAADRVDAGPVRAALGVDDDQRSSARRARRAQVGAQAHDASAGARPRARTRSSEAWRAHSSPASSADTSVRKAARPSVNARLTFVWLQPVSASISA